MSEPVRILIIEDVSSDFDLAQREIRKAVNECVFQLVETRADFLRALETFQPDLILADYQMPSFDGMTALKLAQEHAKLTPFIIWTGTMGEDIAVEMMRAGAVNYILKENIKRLGPAVAHALEEGRLLLEHKRAEETIRNNEKRFRALIENGRDNISLLAVDGTLLWESPATVRGLGYAPDEFVGRSMFDLMHPDDVPWTSELYARLLQEPGSRADGVFRLRHNDGSWRWHEATVTNMLNESGVNAIVVNYRDITERKQAEEMLKEERNLLRTLIDHLPDRIFVMDMQGRKTLSNIADWKASGGETMEDVLGKTDFDTYPPELAQGFWAMDKVVLDSGEAVINYEEPGLDTEGKPVWVLSTKVPLHDGEGKITGLVGIGRDITERKRAEMERQALLEIMQGLVSTDDLHEFLDLIHRSIAKVIYAENFFVVFYNRDTGLFEETYSVDQYDPPSPPSSLEKSITSYVFRSGEPLLLTQDLFDQLAEQGEVELVGTNSESWLGVPLKTPNGTIGVIAVQDYANPNRYTERDRDFLALIGSQVALAIERKQAEDRLRLSDHILQRVNAVVLVADSQGSIVYVSPAARTILGYEPEELLGDNWWKVSRLEPAAAQREKEAVGQIARGEAPNSAEPYERAVQDRSGNTRWISWVDANGFGNTLIGVGHDITERKQAEKALLQSENRYSLASKATNDVIWEWDQETNQLFWNENALSVFGYTAEEIGMYETWWEDHIHADDRERVLSKLNALIAEDATIWADEYRFLRKDGSYAFIIDRAYIERDASGKPLRVIGAMSDITERKRAEDQLNYHARLLRHINDAVIATDDQFRITAWNRAAEKMYGWPSEKVTGHNVSEILNFELSDEERVAARELLKESSTARTERIYRHRDGRTLYVEANTIALLDQYGRMTGYVSVHRDITESKRAEKALEASEKRFRALIENAPDGITLVDAQGIATYVSPSIERILGYSQAEALGRPPIEYLHPDDVSRLLRQLVLLARKTDQVLAQYRFRHKDSSWRWLESTVSNLLGDPGVGGIVFNYRDITDRKQAEQKIQRRVGELEALYQSGLAFSQTFDQNEIAEKVIEVVKVHLNWHHAAVQLRREETDELELIAFSRTDDHDEDEVEAHIQSVVTRVGQGMAGWVIEHGQTLRVGNVNEDPRYVKTYPGMQSGLYVPLKIHERTLGSISVESDQPNAFTQEDERLLATLGVQATVALENARLYEAALRAAQRRHVLYLTGQEMVRVTQDLEQIYAAVHHGVSQLMPAEAFTIVLLDESKNELEGVYLFDQEERWPVQRIPLQGSFSGRVMSSGQSLLIPDIEKTPIEAVHYGTPDAAHSILAVPMRIGERVIGVLSTQSYQANAYTAEDQRLLEMLASQTVIAIENARLFQSAQQELFERKRAEEALHQSEEQYRSLFEDSPISLWVEDFSAVKRRLNELKEKGILDIPAYCREHPSFVTELASQVRILDVNNASMKLYHARQKSELLGSLAEVFHILRPEQFESELIQIASGRLNFEREQVDETLTGEKIHVNMRWSVAPGYEDSLAQVIVSTVDVTERKRAEEQIQLQLQRVRALRAIDIAISSSFDLHLTLNLLLDHAMAQLKTDAAVILLFHPSTRTLEHVASRGFRSAAIRDARLRLGEGYAGKAVLERRMIHISNLVETDRELAYTLSLKVENFIEYYCVPLIVKGEVKGVLEIFHRSTLADDPEWVDFLETLAGQAAIAIDNATLFEDVQHSNRELFQAYDATIEGWSHALDLRDKETEGHTLRVTEMTLELARRFGFTDEQLRYVRWGALLHDIGKMGVPDHILLKPDKLTDEEWASMKKHPVFALEMLSPIAYLKSALDIPYCHHEKWDGTGYPRGLKGEVIPLAARVFAIVDVWDALRSDRPYRKGWSVEKTIEHIKSLSGTHFDPKVVEYFLEMIERVN